MKTFLLLFITCITPAWVLAANVSLPAGFEASPVQNQYWNALSAGEHFLAQDDSSFMNQPILSSDSGSSALCASICALRVTRFARSLLNIQDPFSSETEELQNTAKILWVQKLKIKEGLSSAVEISEVLSELMNQGKVPTSSDPTFKDTLLDSGIVNKVDFFPSPKNSITILRIEAIDPATGEPVGGHAMLEVGENPATDEVILMDPMDPDHPVTAKLLDAGGTNGVSVSFAKPLPFTNGVSYRIYIRAFVTAKF